MEWQCGLEGWFIVELLEEGGYLGELLEELLFSDSGGSYYLSEYFAFHQFVFYTTLLLKLIQHLHKSVLDVNPNKRRVFVSFSSDSLGERQNSYVVVW